MKILLDLEKANRSKLFLVFFLLIFIYDVLSSIVVNAFFPSTFAHISDEINSYELFVQFFLLMLIAPLFETLIFQVIIIEGLHKFKFIPSAIIVLISAVFFAVAHHYNIIYMLAVFPVGLIFSYYYFILREDKYIAFLSVCALHSATNLIAYGNNNILVPFIG